MAVGDASNISVNSSKIVRRAGYPATSLRFNQIIALLCVWFIVGLFVDGAAHNHGAVDNTFFTPWHALLYSSVAAMGALLVYTQYRNVNLGFAWRKALPRGYFLSLLGVILFIFGGVFDMAWHEAFGFEANIEALISPSHLWLASAAFLFITGPLRSGWQGALKAHNKLDMVPVIVSTMVAFSLLTFFTMYNNPLAQPDEFSRPMSSTVSIAAVGGILLLSALMMGCILPLIHRWTLPFGSLAFILGANALLMYGLRFRFIERYWLMIIGAFVVGLMGDALLSRLHPVNNNIVTFRFFAFSLPLLYFMLYFVTLTKVNRLPWSIHMWLGMTFMAGAVGLLLSFLVQPPLLFEDEAV